MLQKVFLVACLALLARGAGAVCPPGGQGTYWACVTTYNQCTAVESCDEYYCSDDSPTGRSRERHYNIS
ncbi:MAG: hypothetical protein HRF46_04135 [Acidobacteriota bacterium]|jgi:hypothetical protein